MYLVKTPQVIQNLFPNFTWRIPTSEKTLYLTFDDGPIPEITPWVLEQLRQAQARATFFCVGQNVDRHPEIFESLKLEGHAAGNHTFRHLNGWHTENVPYFQDVRRCARRVKSVLFRPPYGKLKPGQTHFLQRHYRIVMWDVLSADFDTQVTPQRCLDNVLSKVEPGSIVVFHDSLKAFPRLSYTLPRVLEHFSALGYRFESLEEKMIPKVKVVRQYA